jgi:hypothetical protein
MWWNIKLEKTRSKDAFSYGSASANPFRVFVGGVLVFTELRENQTNGRIAKRSDAYQPIGQLPGCHAFGGCTQTTLQQLGDMGCALGNQPIIAAEYNDTR